MAFLKSGQASMDYLIFSAVIFLLLLPGVYLYLKPLFLTPLGLTSVPQFSTRDLSNQDVVEAVAEAIKTVARLNRAGTGMEFTVYKFDIASNAFQDGVVLVITKGGDVFSTGSGVSDIYAHRNALQGFGYSVVRVKKSYLGAVGVGTWPTFSGICPQDIVYPTREQCSSASFPTSEGVYFLGTGLADATVAHLAKLTTGLSTPKTIPTCAEPACTKDSECSDVCITDSCVCADTSVSLPSCTDIDCDLRRYVPQSGTGVGTYVMAVATSQGAQSNSKLITMTPSS